MNTEQTGNYQLQLKNELEFVRNRFLLELKQSKHPYTGELALVLEQNAPADWLDLIASKVTPEQFPRYQRLVQLEAALCQIDIGQFGYCCDCEVPLTYEELKKDAATQRCHQCQSKVS
ncbi:conjugal transfer protein TraR [Pseudoalteromonas sp. MMG013]|uniref:Conjugal transfer protein TraR n=1 Tax=Pseudoalteromonas aurantia 208 TaxID=1314867 RepID=A0ABR9ED64_9GAMM|nr:MULTISPECIES: conjugal transfer protein TraR [Pseudoalteromonas]MBE0368717.1 hypothetical protein [Pseudoalteromonas aurantia 208]MBQ4847961.1 conjugal transfer protein TraR [Pseudoalteromonas sp. MMG005]MBQ4849508.1 conjugal transfer protein TraR [Pseudoalteromonas sp. MMG012]MBQ4863771.1 conjugal transfer protein TraR [Pseudoalteromonas sp. MMG013]